MAKRKNKSRRTKSAEAARGSDGASSTEGSRAKGAESPKGSESLSPAHDLNVPSWLPWLLYVVATVVLFREFVASRDMLFGGDTLGLGYMARAFYAEALQAGEFPLWNPIILGGTPFLDSLAGGDSLYPPSLLLLALIEPYRALGWKLVVHVFAAGPLMALWVRSLGVSKASAVICGLAYMVAPFFVALVFPGHDGKMFVTALAPLAFWAAERVLSHGGWGRLAAMAGVIGLIILTTHFQMAYFLFGSMGLYAIFRTVQLGRIGQNWGRAGGRFAMFMGAALLGAGIAGVQLLPAFSYVSEFSRRAENTTQVQTAEQGLAYGSSYALHPEEAASLIVPEFVGGNVDGAEWTDGTYWGRNPFKSNHEYIGWVILILAGLSFFGAPRPGVRRLLFGLGAVALLFGLGRTTPVWRFFYEFVPGIDYFRAPSQVIFITGFAWISLAGFGVDRAVRLFGSTRRLSEDDARWADRLEKALFALGGIALVSTVLWMTGLFESMWTSVVFRDMLPQQTEALERARPFITRGFVIMSFLTLATIGAWVALRRSWLAPAGALVVLAGLVMADGIRVNQPFIQTFDFDRWAAPDPNIEFLVGQLNDPEPWRLLSMEGAFPGQEVRPGMYGIELAGGHHPNDLGRYRDLSGMVGSGEPTNLLAYPQLLAMLNVRYLTWPVLRAGALEGLTEVSSAVLQDGRVLSTVYELPALPRARLVGNARVLADDEVMPAMLDSSFDPGQEVLLTEEPPIALDGALAQGTVTWASRSNNRSVLEVQSARPALLVVADNWYPAWAATVNGEPAPVLRAYHTLRAIPVGAGTSRVEMFYDSSHTRGPFWMSIVSILVALGLGLTQLRKPAASEPEPEAADIPESVPVVEGE